MLEATLPNGAVLKKLIDVVKDMVAEANWECSETGIALQSMDTAHVVLVNLLLRADGFEPYRCDRTIPLGLSIQSMHKILKCAGTDDKITLSAEDNGDRLNFLFEGKNERVSEFELKLMDIDQDQLGIPDGEFEAQVEMPSTEFQRICRDLSSIGESVTVSVSKEGLKFAVDGDIGTGSVTIKPNASVDDEAGTTSITMSEPIEVILSVKYLSQIAKAGSLSDSVLLCFGATVPTLLEYKLGELGYLRFYLAPKINEDEEGGEEEDGAAVDMEED